MDGAVDAVAYTKEGGSDGDVGGLTHLDRACYVDGSDHDGTVDAMTYLHVLNICVNVDIRVLTAHYSYILVLNLVLSYYNTLIKSIHVHNLIL